MRGYPLSVIIVRQIRKKRRYGYSIREISSQFNVPVATVWNYVQNIKLAPKYARVLAKKTGGSAKRTQIRWWLAKQEASELLRLNRESCIIVAMLYWGEGNKKCMEFINSDGKMVAIYLQILRRVFHVPEERLAFTLRIFTGMSRSKSLVYWTKITKASSARFKVCYNDGGSHSRTQYGLCRITVKKGSYEHKIIMSLIDLLSGQLLLNQVKV